MAKNSKWSGKSSPYYDSSIVIATIDDVASDVGKLYDLVRTCLGPSGCLKAVTNAGGHTTVTSCSSRLFNALSITKPVHKLIIGSIQNHLALFQDGGLTAALLASRLITKSLKSTLSRNFMIDVYECLLQLTADYIKCDEFYGKITLKQSDVNIHLMISIVRCVIKTKPVCSLFSDDLSHVCRTVVGAFLQSIPNEVGSKLSMENVSVVTIEKQTVERSCVVDGLLVRLYDFNSSRGLSADGRRSVRVAVVTISLAGDSDDLASYKLETSGEAKVEEVMNANLMSFCERLLELKVDVLMCQKVIHPDLQHFCSRRGLLAVERLGQDTCDSLLRITGCHAIGCITTNVCPSHIGTIDRLSRISVCDRDYLVVSMAAAPTATLVICAYTDDMLSELKTVCVSALHALYDFMSHHTLLHGGGCWLVHLSHHLLSQVRLSEACLMTQFSCTKHELREACRTFVSSLHHVVQCLGRQRGQTFTNADFTHAWHIGINQSESSQTCGCGTRTSRASHLQTLDAMFDDGRHATAHNVPDAAANLEFLRACQSGNTDIVVDGFSCALNAYLTAVTTAISVLGIHQYIYETI